MPERQQKEASLDDDFYQEPTRFDTFIITCILIGPTAIVIALSSAVMGYVAFVDAFNAVMQEL